MSHWPVERPETSLPEQLKFLQNAQRSNQPGSWTGRNRIALNRSRPQAHWDIADVGLRSCEQKIPAQAKLERGALKRGIQSPTPPPPPIRVKARLSILRTSPGDLKIYRGLLVFRRQVRPRRAFSCCAASSRRANGRSRPASAASIVWLRGAIPQQGVVQSSAARSERTRLQRSVIHRIKTGGSQGLGIGVAIARLPDDDRMTDGANRADLAVFARDQIATPEAPFSDVAVLADTRPDFLNGGIDDDRHRQIGIVRIGIEQRRGYWWAKAPCWLRWKLTSFGEHFHVLQPF